MTPAEAIERSRETVQAYGGERYIDEMRACVQKVGFEMYMEITRKQADDMFGPSARAAFNSREFRMYVAGLLGMC